MSEIIFKDLKIEHIYNKRLKYTYISVKHSDAIDADLSKAKVVLKTPNLSDGYIKNLLIKKESWIREQILKIEQAPVLKVNLEDEVLLFGDIYSIDSDEAFRLRELLFRLKNRTSQNILKCYDIFYKEYSKKYIIPRVEYFSKIMNLEYKEIKFRKMKSRWGSCGSNKILTFNTELLKIKKELIDYVVVHELAHLVYMNHSKNFHALVEKYILNSKDIRKELKNIKLQA